MTESTSTQAMKILGWLIDGLIDLAIALVLGWLVGRWLGHGAGALIGLVMLLYLRVMGVLQRLPERIARALLERDDG